MTAPNLTPRTSPGAAIIPQGNGWHFSLPQGDERTYRLAQLDDYATLARKHFPWREPTALSLRCRVSEQNLPGTWGFGLWNDPFALSLGTNAAARRIPTLPNAAWVFHASKANHLSFTSNRPASGFLAQAFSAVRIPSLALAPGMLAAPLLLVPAISRWMRTLAGKLIREDAQRLDVDVTQWHEYRLQWGQNQVEWAVDGEIIFQSGIHPRAPLGLVIWIDNQFMAWHPDGSLKMGVQANPAAWMEIENLVVE